MPLAAAAAAVSRGVPLAERRAGLAALGWRFGVGGLDAAALRGAVHALLRRHPQLSAGFRHGADGVPVQLWPHRFEVGWAERDAPAEADVTRYLEADRVRRFDLAEPPLLRAQSAAPRS